MTALCIGLALVWLIVWFGATRRGKSFTIEGFGIVFILAIAYGLGTIVLMVLKR